VIEPTSQFDGLNVTFSTTEDCNLACKYCYEINKKPKSLKLETAKAFIDILLEDKDPINALGTNEAWILDQGIILDFIGGDSLMDPQLVDEILKYFIYRTTATNHKWAYNWRASISTNGTLFEKKEVRDFVEKYKKNLSLGISIDGCPAIHDANRIFKDGSPSMPIIEKWLPWYRSVFDNDDHSRSTKATCNKESIPYLYESLVYMHEKLGLDYIYQNFIYEDMHLEQSDLDELDRQLELCRKYVLDHSDSLYWSMIDIRFAQAHKTTEEEKTKGHCGSGMMPALSISGKVYPCFRWLPHTQQADRVDFSVGDVNEGHLSSKENYRKVADNARRNTLIMEDKCRDCEIESICSYCIGGCYAEYGEFRRQTHICEIHKLQAKHGKLYWAEFAAKKEREKI